MKNISTCSDWRDLFQLCFTFFGDATLHSEQQCYFQHSQTKYFPYNRNVLPSVQSISESQTATCLISQNNLGGWPQILVSDS